LALIVDVARCETFLITGGAAERAENKNGNAKKLETKEVRAKHKLSFQKY
jgi:hypothetical protein